MTNMSEYSMMQWVHFREHEFVLFKFWKVGSFWGMVASMFISFLLCILYEAIKGLRVFIEIERIKQRRAREDAARAGQASGDGDNTSQNSISFAPLLQLSGFTKRIFTPYRIAQSVLYGIQSLLAYSIMLIVMTFNGNLILSVVVGEAVGYFLFTGTPLIESAMSDCH